MAEGILEGSRVLEWGDFVSAPWTGRLLGDLGAEVLKLEQPVMGDRARRAGPFPQDVPHPEKSGLYLYLNCNKRGVTLDVSTPTGKEVFLRLVERVDILVESHSPAEVEALGLTYDDLRRVNPRLIMTSISPFGQTGPYRDYVGSELVLFQMGGVGYETPLGVVTDIETQQPLKGPGYQAFMVAGWMAAATTMIGVYHREVFGEGQHIDISVHEAMASMVRPNVTRVSYAHEVPRRDSPSVIRHKPCKDGYFTGLAIGNNEDTWRRVCALMGNPEWTKEEIYATQESRTEHVQEADAHIIEWMRDYTKAELFEMTQSQGIGAFPLNTIEDVFHSDQLEHRDFFIPMDHPVAGQWLYPGTAYLFTDQQPRVQHRAPLLGEHNAEVYCGELGYTPEELLRLHHAGVV